MKKFALAVLLASTLAACQDVTRPARHLDVGSPPAEGAAGDLRSVPDAPARNTVGDISFTMGNIAGPGSTGPSIQYQGTYNWNAMWSTNYTLESTQWIKWYVSSDNATWTEVKSEGYTWTGSGNSFYSRTLNTTNHGSFWLRVIGSVSGAKGTVADTSELFVPVPNPLDPPPAPATPLSVTINGPGSVSTEGYNTWQAVASYGTGSYAYKWRAYWHQSGMWEDLGNSEFQSLYIVRDHGSFVLEATATSGSETATTTRMVCNFIPPTDFSCS